MADANDPVEQMYDLLAVELLNMLKTPACDKCGTHGLSSSHLTVIRQFLSDNEMKRIVLSRPTGPAPIGRVLPFGSEDGEQPVQKLA